MRNPRTLVSCCRVSYESPPEAEEKLERSPAKAAAEACAGIARLEDLRQLLLLCRGAARAGGIAVLLLLLLSHGLPEHEAVQGICRVVDMMAMLTAIS